MQVIPAALQIPSTQGTGPYMSAWPIALVQSYLTETTSLFGRTRSRCDICFEHPVCFQFRHGSLRNGRQKGVLVRSSFATYHSYFP